GASPTLAAVRAGGTPTNLVRQLANPLIHSVGSAIPIPNTGKMPVWPKPRYGKQAGRPKIIQAAQAKIFEQLQARGFKLGISTELRASVADQLGKQVFAEFPNKKEIGFLGRRLRHHHHVEMPRSYDVWVSHTDGAVTDIRIVPSTDTITMSSFGRSTPGIALLGTVAMYAGAGALIASEEAGVAEREAPPSPAYYRALNIQQRIEQGLAGTVQGAVGLTIDNAPAGLGTLVWRAAEGSLPYLGMADRLKAIRGNFRAYDPVQANDQEAVTSTALDQLIITSVTRELYKQLKNPALNFQALHGREGTGSQRIASLANSFLVTDNPTGHPFAGTIQAQRAYSNGQGWIDIGRIIGKGEKVTLPVRVTTPQGVVTAYVPGTLEGQIQFAAAPDEKTPNALYINPHTGPVAEIQARQLYFTPQSGDRAGERIPVAPGYSSTVPIYLPGTMAQRVANHVVIATSGREVRLHDAHRLPGSQATWDRYWGSVMDRFAPLLPPPEARRGPQRTGDAETTPGAVNLATANIPTEVTAAHAKPDRPTQVEVTFHSGLTPSGAG
ncbi:MAG: hypothetical protein EBZ69_03485, partial [Alphaproteobacteria bacterium]|nr:hypothetical protein [Alphaproteobacteria bacterium]